MKQCVLLNFFRFNKFLAMVSSNRVILSPDKLPPTERSARFHNFRVHLQIIIWKTLDTSVLDPLHWGCRKVDNHFAPIKTDFPPAPDRLLNFIRRNCTTASKKSCAGKMCNCRKNGLHCVSASGQCHGETCSNSKKVR